MNTTTPSQTHMPYPSLSAEPVSTAPSSPTSLSASRLVSLLQVLGALTLDYVSNPSGKAPDTVKQYYNIKAWQITGLAEAVAASEKGGDKLQALYNLSLHLKALLPSALQQKEFTTPELRLFKAFKTYFATDSDNALNFIKKNAALLGPHLARAFTPTVSSSDHNALRKVVKDIAGRDGKHLTSDESSLAKETSPAKYSEYVTQRKAHNKEFKDSLTAYVRASGKKLVDYSSAFKEMNALGFTHSMISGFTGKIDDSGRWYTTDGKLLLGSPSLFTYTHIIMNDGKDPSQDWTFKAVKPDRSFAYGYTAEYRKAAALEKYAKVSDLSSKIDKIRNRWCQYILKFDPSSKASICAAVLEILYSFAARVGSKPGRGVATLLVKNASITSTGVNLQYLGKDSINTKHMIKTNTSNVSKALVSALEQMIEGKTPSSFLFTTEKDGKFYRVKPSDVNAFFHLMGCPTGLSVHKLRTVRATALFVQLMEKDALRRAPMSDKEAMERYRTMTEEVGKLLNHKRGVDTANESVTGTTAALNYIDASAQTDLFDRWGVKMPVNLEKLLRGNENDE
jgi:hypothetical protein